MTALTSCAHCRASMPLPTGRQARKRYCSELCRKAAWRVRHRDDVPTRDPVSNAVPDPVPDRVPDRAVPTASRDDVATRGSQHRCPHCRQPLAIVSVVIPADAAIVPLPEVRP